MGDSLVVGSKVKEAVKAEGCNSAGDLADALSMEVAAMIKKDAKRDQANGRKTVRAAAL
jgi:hypothetical protein